MRIFLIFSITIFSLLMFSCSSIPSKDIETINEQQELIVFLKNIINSNDDFSVTAMSRKTFSPITRQTKLMTHSFYLITLKDGSNFTLSFTNANKNIFKFKDNGIWILNKATDINPYNLFIKGKNLWNVDYMYKENILDSYQTLNNIINVMNIETKYYYKDHLKDKPDSFNCNSALNETIAFKPINIPLSDTIALK